MGINLYPIGTIHSPYNKIDNMPIQPSGAIGVKGTLEIEPEYIAGLQDLEGFSHIILLYHFHKAGACELLVTPFLDSKKRGVFATRAPTRPNPLGLSIVRLLGIKQNIISIDNIDVLDGTPLLDIKPYVPEFDHQISARVGWLEKRKGRVQKKRSDNRFA